MPFGRRSSRSSNDAYRHIEVAPTSKRLLVGLGYVVLVIALVLTLPIGTEMYGAGK